MTATLVQADRRSATLAAVNAELTSATATPKRSATALAIAPHRGARRLEGLDAGHSEHRNGPGMSRLD